jgi:TATA-box binding protein (TBP) (component of TFIID and TFIIIB)
MTTTPRIFTMTVSISLGFPVDLIEWAKGIEIEKDTGVIGLKYKLGNVLFLKGTYSSSRQKIGAFHNQVSLVIFSKNENKNINVKVFANGKLHITGCTVKETAYEIKEILTNLKIKKTLPNLMPDENGIPIERHLEGMLIYGLNLKCIGYKLNDTNIIKGTPCDFHTGKQIFVAQKSTGKYTYPFFDLNGDFIGYKKLELTGGSKKLFFNKHKIQPFYDTKTDTELLMSEGNNIVGVYHYCLLSSSPKEDDDVIDTNDTPQVHSAMCSFKLSQPVDRDQLFGDLMSHGCLATFNPNKYSGVHWVFQLDPISDPGGSISTMIFQSGNVIFSGVKSEEQIDITYRYILEKLFLVSKIN